MVGYVKTGANLAPVFFINVSFSKMLLFACQIKIVLEKAVCVNTLCNIVVSEPFGEKGSAEMLAACYHLHFSAPHGAKFGFKNKGCRQRVMEIGHLGMVEPHG